MACFLHFFSQNELITDQKIHKFWQIFHMPYEIKHFGKQSFKENSFWQTNLLTSESFFCCTRGFSEVFWRCASLGFHPASNLQKKFKASKKWGFLKGPLLQKDLLSNTNHYCFASLASINPFSRGGTSFSGLLRLCPLLQQFWWIKAFVL